LQNNECRLTFNFHQWPWYLGNRTVQIIGFFVVITLHTGPLILNNHISRRIFQLHIYSEQSSGKLCYVVMTAPTFTMTNRLDTLTRPTQCATTWISIPPNWIFSSTLTIMQGTLQQYGFSLHHIVIGFGG